MGGQTTHISLIIYVDGTGHFFLNFLPNLDCERYAIMFMMMSMVVLRVEQVSNRFV